MTTNGVGLAKFDTEKRRGGGTNPLDSYTVRVVRTVEYLISTSPPVKKEATMLLENKAPKKPLVQVVIAEK